MKGSKAAGWILVVVAAALAGCGSDSENAQQGNSDATQSEAGYYSIMPISFSMQRGDGGAPLETSSSQARVFYSYHPAEGGPAGKPLFVMLNGGPGCATTTNLFSMNTAPYTLDVLRTGKDTPYVKNESSWTRLGNVLYIDAPNTGFSYNVVPFNNVIFRELDFAASANPFVDAAQVVRVVLRFLGDHDSIRKSPVVLVGESYGGTRVSTMLNLLLFHRRYGDGRAVYRDTALVEEIETHLTATTGGNPPYAPEIVAAQFGREILIEPELSGPYQNEETGTLFEKPDSVIERLANAVGKKYQHCGDSICNKATLALYQVQYMYNRDRYIYSRPSSWSDDLEAHAMQGLLNYDTLSKILGVDANSIPQMKASARNSKGAYRYVVDKSFSLTHDIEYLQSLDGYAQDYSEREQATLMFEATSATRIASQLRGDDKRSLPNILGGLSSVDDYLVGTNNATYAHFIVNAFTLVGIDLNPERAPRYGQLFLENLALVDTFLTDAELDLVIYTPAIPPALARYTDIVEKVDVTWGTELAGAATNGSVTVTYKPNSLPDVATPASRTIHMPYYATSGHSVSSTQPEKFLSDVTQWLARTDG